MAMKAKIPGKQKSSNFTMPKHGKVVAHKKPKTKMIDKPGKPIVGGKGKARERRLAGKAL